MVFERLFKTKWIEQKPRYALLLGFLYSIVGVVSSFLIFKSYIGLMAVAFTSILMIPTLNHLLRDEENAVIRRNKFHVGQLFMDHKDVFEIYFFLFLGVFFTFAILPLFLPLGASLAWFGPQLKVAGITGFAFSPGMFWSILLNNLLILGVCLVLSFVYGSGSILFICWNASVWGAIFGFVAKQSALVAGQNPFASFWMIILPILPHMIVEATAYFSAAIVGGVISKAVLREKLFSKKFYHVVTDALLFTAIGIVLVVLGAWIEARLF